MRRKLCFPCEFPINNTKYICSYFLGISSNILVVDKTISFFTGNARFKIYYAWNSKCSLPQNRTLSTEQKEILHEMIIQSKEVYGYTFVNKKIPILRVRKRTKYVFGCNTKISLIFNFNEMQTIYLHVNIKYFLRNLT